MEIDEAIQRLAELEARVSRLEAKLLQTLELTKDALEGVATVARTLEKIGALHSGN